jgi:hypothetical protein
MEAEGARVALPARVNLSDIQAQLSNGGLVTVAINTAPPGVDEYWHAITVEQIVRGPNGSQVVFGDPWNGNFWSVDACTFWQKMDPRPAVFVNWRP